MSQSRKQVGVVVVTHGRLAEELVAAARVIVGAPAEHLRHISLGWNDPLESAREQVRACIAAAELGGGVLVLTDMFGGTPTNICLSFLAQGRVEILTGVNLPMVVKSANLASELDQGLSLREIAERVAARGRESVIVPSSMLEPEATPRQGAGRG